MKGRTSKRILSALLSLVMLLSLLPVAAFATETATTATWTKVTSAPEDWSGTYLIVSEGDKLILDGSRDKLDGEGNKIDVTIADGTITGDYAKYAFTIASMEGGYSIQSASGKYISGTANKNALNSNAAAVLNTIAMSDGNVIITSNNTTLQYNNAATNGTRFRYYKSQNQQPIALYALTATGGSETETVAAPTANYPNGSDLEIGTQIEFTCETEGATIQYHTGDGNWVKYTAPIPVNANTAFTVKAVSATGAESDAATFTYTAYKLVDKYVKADTIATGDKVIIYNTGNTSAISATMKGSYYLTPVTATVAENALTADDMSAIVWTVTKNDDGTYTFAQGENTLTMGTNNGKFNLNLTSDGATNWDLEAIGTGGAYTMSGNGVTGQYGKVYIEYYAKYTEFSAYCTSTDRLSEKDFGMTFFKLTQEKQPVDGETPAGTVAAPTASPAAGEIDKGTKVTFSCATTDATILYKTTGDYTTYTGPITVNEDTTFTVKATKDGMNPSAEVTFIYTVKAEAGDKYVLADTIDTGDQVVIYYPKDKKIMTTEGYTYTNKNTGKSKDEMVAAGATVTGSELTTAATNAAVLTVTKDANGKYTFTTADGRHLYMDGTHVRLVNTADANTLFQLEPATNGWFIKADTAQVSNKAQYLEYFGGYFTVFGMSSNTAIYTFQFYKLARATDPVSGLQDGDKVAIYNDANAIAIGTAASGSNLTGVATTLDGELVKSAAGMAEFTVRVNDQNQLTFVCDGKYLTSAQTGKGLSLAAAESDYSLWVAEANGSGFYLKNVNAQFKTNAQYLQVFNSNFSTFGLGTGGDNYTVTFRKIAADTPDTGDLPKAGDQVVIYNANANAALAAQDKNPDSPSITKSGAVELTDDGKLAKGNGAAVFTVEQSGQYLRFKNETYGYLCANGTGNNAFYSQAVSEDADWLVRTCSGGVGGFEMESRTAKYKGYSQWLEYYSDSFKVYSMDKSKVTDYTIYSFQFLPVADGVRITNDIVNQPAVDFGTVQPAYVGQEYALTFTVDAPFGVNGDMTAKLGEKTLDVTKDEDGVYTAVIPVEDVTGTELTVTVTGTDNQGIAITGEAKIEVKDEPSITDPFPAKGTETGDDKRPVIGATVVNAGEDPTVTMTVNNAAVTLVKGDNGKYTYTPTADMSDGRVTVTMTVTRANAPTKTATLSWFFTVGEAQYQMYFGQLHSHTQYSDGSGSLESALAYVKSLPESANVQFVAFTDHSNYFDKSGAANPEGALYDMSLATEYSQSTWSSYKSAIDAFNAENNGIVAIGGFEMTWSGGPGHINTFNTPGIVSRNNSTLNNKTDDAGMKAYYKLLSQTEGADSISQFNHPGKTFGNFSDFSYWDAMIDTRMYMVEVGNGEGQIGAGGYYPSYEQYIMALDKGWHVAPTNNQDNHKGKWGNANDARDVIITDDFSEEGIYAAIRARHMYATEDKNLEVTYTVNGNLMGTIIEDIPAELDISITVSDPDASDSISKVELVANSGRVIKAWDTAAELASGELSATLAPEYSYYFVRVTEGDGDLAVTAPVWVGDTLKLGITSTETNSATPVTGEELTVTTTLFNSEATDATVKTITYSIGSEVIGIDEKGYTLPANGTLPIDFNYTPTSARVVTITVTAVVVQDGKEFTFAKDITLDVLNADSLVYIGIDASHYNEYVNGNYKDNMGNFSALAAEYSIRTVTLSTSEELIAACSNPKYKALILTAPSRRDGDDTLRNPYSNYTDDEITAIKGFNETGGTVILTGWSDYYESYKHSFPFPAEDHMAAQQNRILSALGSSLRISDDGTLDDTLNGGQPQRLYFSTYNLDHPLMNGVEFDPDHPNDVLYTERFSQYGGASIYAVGADGTLPATVSPMVYGHATTVSKDQDSDGLGGANTPKYTVAENDSRLLVMATEQLSGKGLIVVSGAAFLSNFEVQAKVEDSGAEKNYSNYKICENLLNLLNPTKISTVAEVQAEPEEGVKFTIEAIVTSNASGYDKDTAFFDCIYAQDDTAGINCFPVAGNFKVGDKVRITGTTSSYQGERQLSVSSIKKIGEATPIEPTKVTAAQVTDGSVLGSLIKVSGTVTKIEEADGLVQTIMVKDAAGNECRIFIDGYITINKAIQDLAIGCKIEAIGLASYDDTFVLSDGTAVAPRIRIRDRADIICTKSGTSGDCSHVWGAWTTVKDPTCTETGSRSHTCKLCGYVETGSIPATGHDYVNGKCKVCGKLKPTSSQPTVKPATPVKSGATADTSNMGLWLVMLSLSLFGSVTLLRSRKRRA